MNQMVSDSAADMKILESEDSLQASLGVVNEMMFAMHPTGKACRSNTVLQQVIMPSSTGGKRTDFLMFHYVSM